MKSLDAVRHQFSGCHTRVGPTGARSRGCSQGAAQCTATMICSSPSVQRSNHSMVVHQFSDIELQNLAQVLAWHKTDQRDPIMEQLHYYTSRLK